MASDVDAFRDRVNFGRLPDTKALKSTLVRQQYDEDPILKPEAQGQIAEFRAAFESNSDKRAYFEPRLFFIRDAQRAIAAHNAGRQQVNQEVF